MKKGIAIQLVDNTNIGEICDLKIEVKHDLNGKIISGICIGSTVEQNKALLLILQPGEIKERPYIGVGFNNILLGGDLLEYRHKIRKNFSYDELNLTELKLYNLNQVSIKANY